MPRLSEYIVRFFAPDAGPGAYNDWTIVSTSTFSRITLFILMVIIVLSLVASVMGTRRVPWRRRLPLVALRILAAFWIAALIFKPAVELRAVSRVQSRVAVLVDASRSMGLATKDGTRSEAVERHLADNEDQLRKLAEVATIEKLTFGARTEPQDPLPSPLPHDLAKTDILRAINEVFWQSSGRELGAVILYSDGADTEGFSVDLARRKAAQLGAPIYTIGFAEDAAAPDLAVRRIIADDFAFVHNTVVLDVEIEQRGLDISSVMATLKQDGKVVQTKPVELGSGVGRVAFEFKPRQIGKQVYQVSVPVQSGEVVESNNEKSLVLKVIRDRIRVLQVVGRPSWDERFLREFLKRNPNVDLISFFILRSTTDVQKAPQEELALIPFPVNELFTKELPSFDVVIYQNFSYRPYRMAHYLRNVREYVMKGGSFLMIGGNFGFEDGWYAGTPIADILPVRLGGAMPWDAGDYRPRLTPQGRQHPITRIGEPGEPPDAVYRRLPKLAGFNSSFGLAPGAQSLLSHPSLPGNPPVIAIREVGKGRSMSVATDSMWFWRFTAVGEGSAGREFDRMWTNSLRWLIRDPELSRVRLDAARSVVLKGDPIGAEVTVLGPDYRPLSEANVGARLIKVGTGEVVKSFETSTQEEGKSLLRFEGIPPGAYVIKVDAKKGRESIGAAREPVIVEAADVEFHAPFPRPELLEALSEASGGRFVDVGDSMPDIEIKDARRVEVDRTRRVPIWNTLFAFLCLLLVVGLEWWLRRRSGLL